MLKSKLQPFINRYEEINNLLMAPDITNDIKRMTDLSKEQSNMQPIVIKAREYIKLMDDIDENKRNIDRKFQKPIRKSARDLEPCNACYYRSV